jgi:hypothetical protein
MLSAWRKMPCVAKWKKQQISTHASRISAKAKLGHPIANMYILTEAYLWTVVIKIRADADVPEMPEHAVVVRLPYTLVIGEPIGVVARRVVVAATEGAAAAIDFGRVRHRIPRAVRDEILDLVRANGVRVAREVVAVDE